MPLTWFAHQVPIAPLKLRRPEWFDATALCVGSMTPDLMYAASGYIGFDTHDWVDGIAYGVPTGLFLTVLLRVLVAPAVAPALPDLGAFRLRSYGVIATRRPHLLVTLSSLLIGIASHLVLDTFTHDGRDGTRLLGYDDVTVTVAGHTEPLAGVLQLIGHSFGTLAGVWLLRHVGAARLLERWYGSDAVDAARRTSRPGSWTTALWASVAVGTLLGVAWGWNEPYYVARVERVAVAALGATTAWSAAWRLSVGRRSPVGNLDPAR